MTASGDSDAALAKEWMTLVNAEPLGMVASGKFREMERQRNEWAESRDYWRERAERAEATVTHLRQALETICEIGETRDVEVARAALAQDTETKE